MMKINVAIPSDDNYVEHLSVCLYSLLHHHTHFDEIKVIILDAGISLHNKFEISKIADGFKREIVFYDLKEKLIELKSQYNISEGFSLSSYCRLFLAEIATQDDRLLYVDSDSMFMNSLDGILNYDISKFALAAVEDHVDFLSKTKIDLLSNDRYFNSGFMWINLKYWRENNAFDQMINILKKFKGNVPFYDQGILNALFNKSVLFLPPHYNVMTSFYDFKSVESIKNYYGINNYYHQAEIDEGKKNPIFVHFTPSFSKRPWIEGSLHPLKNIYRDFLLQTPFKNNKLQKDKRLLKIRIIEKLYWILGEKKFKFIFK